MDPQPFQRKLAAVLYADVAGYSRLTGTDEEGTHRRLSESLDLVSTSVENHHGRVVHYAGDAVLADFGTVTDALTCAACVQRDLHEKNADLPEDRKVQFRIGVNLGEVIVDRHDIYGEGVNVAARLESLAEPGGVCISGTVYDAIGTKLPLEYEFLGEQQVKNIAKPVRAYQVRLRAGAILPAQFAIPEPKRFTKRLAFLTGALVIVIAGGGLAWFQPWLSTQEKSPEVEPRAETESRPAEPEESDVEDRDGEMARLLAAAETDLEALRLTTPPGNNAFERYRQVLELDPANAEAQKGLERIVQSYTELAVRAESQGKIIKAEGYLRKAEAVIPDAEIIARTRSSLTEERVMVKKEERENEQQTVTVASVPEAQADKERGVALTAAREELERLREEKLKLEHELQAERIMEVRTDTASLRVALFPQNYFYSWGQLTNDTVLVKKLESWIRRNEKLNLIYSYYDTNYEHSSIPPAREHWVGGASQKQPDSELVYRAGEQLNADVTVMLWYRLTQTMEHDLSSNPNVRVKIYIFDIKRRRRFVREGTRGDYESVWSNVLAQLTESRASKN